MFLFLNMEAIVDHVGLHVLKGAHHVIVLAPILFLPCVVQPLILSLDGNVVALGFNLQALPIGEEFQHVEVGALDLLQGHGLRVVVDGELGEGLIESLV
jgi:hypothetical protein